MLKKILYSLFILQIVLNWNINILAHELSEMIPDKNFKIIYDFTENNQIDEWTSINDNVMGGISKGKVIHSNNSFLQFSGRLSLENNGGFASIRTQLKNYDLDSYTGVKIKVKGDGRLYQIRLRSSDSYDGIAFKHDLKTIEGEWQELEFLFSSFVPTYRGRILKDVGPISTENIKQLGFLIADKDTSSFKIIIDEIAVYK